MAALSREGARFFAKVQRQPGDGCWLWTGALNSDGYGVFRRGNDGTGRYPLVLAHRLGYQLLHGAPLSPDVVLLHECDDPRCIRHTRPGTQAENVADMWRKGRARPGGRRCLAQLAEASATSPRARRRLDLVTGAP